MVSRFLLFLPEILIFIIMKKLSVYFIATLVLMAAKSIFAQEGPPDIIGWSDDKHYLEYRMNNEGVTQVWKVNAETGKDNLYSKTTLTEDVNEKLPEGFSVKKLDPVHPEEIILFNQDNDLHIFSIDGSSMKQITNNPEEEKNATLDQNATKVAFTRENDLYVVDIETAKETRLTFDGSDRIKNGYSSWVYWEEIHGRATNFKTFWWSPDGSMIAFERFDDTPVPVFMVYNPDGTHGEWEKAHYPKVGDPNPGVKLGVVHLNSGNITWIDSNDDEDVYIAFPMWSADSKSLFYQRLNRDQDHMQIFKADPFNGDKSVVYSETQETWIDWFSDLYIMKNGNGFIVRSDKSGWRNLYFLDIAGKQEIALTNLNCRIKSLDKVDEENGVVYFTATGDSSINSLLYRVNLDGSGLTRLTAPSGKHETKISENWSFIIDTWSNFHTPVSTQVIDNNGKTIRQLGGYPLPDKPENELCSVEYFTIPTNDGFHLPAYWILPPDFDPEKKYGILYSIYGGPDFKAIENEYIDPVPNFFALNNIILFVVDHRGSGQFGKKGLNYLYRNLGKWDLDDYITAAKWLRNQDFIDTNKIGIMGGSYGGYMTALALTRGADYFTVGISSSPVTDFRLYDNVYTERYMDTYETNPEGYNYGSVMTHADKLKGKLYIMHGTMDDNVHMQNILQLIGKFQDLNKDFDLMIYPKGRHGWGPPKWYHSVRETKEYLIENLGQ